MLHTHKPQTEDTLAAMAARNAARVQIAKRVMGTKYACHPVNHIHRNDAHRIVSVKLSDAAVARLVRDLVPRIGAPLRTV
jgi:hypothetical protein